MKILKTLMMNGQVYSMMTVLMCSQQEQTFGFFVVRIQGKISFRLTIKYVPNVRNEN